MVRIKDKEGTIVETTTTDEAGKFRTGLTRKDYKLDIIKPNYQKKLNVDVSYLTFWNKLKIVLTKK